MRPLIFWAIVWALLTAAAVLFNNHVQAQVTCYQLGAYTTCDGLGSQSVTITELSRNKGMITTDTDSTPYTLMPSMQLDRRSEPSRGLEPLRSLDRLDASDLFLNDDDAFLKPLFPTLGGY